jgi:hypothetical protein
MTDKLLALSSSDLSAIANPIRSGRLNAPFRPVGLQRILTDASTAEAAGELQSLIDRGFAAQHVAELLEAIVMTGSAGPRSTTHSAWSPRDRRPPA